MMAAASAAAAAAVTSKVSGFWPSSFSREREKEKEGNTIGSFLSLCER